MSFYGDLHHLNFVKELNMTDQLADDSAEFAGAATKSIQALEARIAQLEKNVLCLTGIAGTVPREFVDDFKDLENVVYALAPIAPAEHHGVILPWLDKMGARVKAAVEKL